jgi:hypothetical protein
MDHVERESGFGPGLYVTYLFTLTWAIDAVWCLVAIESYRSRPAWLSRVIHLFMAFVVLNATVVFGSWPGRLLFGGVFAVVGSVFAMRQWRRAGPRAPVLRGERFVS